MRRFWIVFSIIAVLLIGSLGLLWKAMTSLDDAGPIRGNVLHWRAAGAYPEQAPDSFLDHLQAGDVPTHYQLLFALQRAADDPDIETLVIDLRGVSLNWAQLEELHAAVGRFRAAGKTVWAYVEQGGNADFALAAAADRIAMAPEGQLMVLGVVAELAFLRETLDKVGLQADFLHVGKYKSAPEQLTRSSASEDNLAMTTSLVDERYRLLVDLIAAGRGRDPQEVRDWIDVGVYDGPDALAAGLVDTLLDANALLDGLFAPDDLADLDRYALRGTSRKGDHEVALLVAAGTIVTGESGQDNLQGRLLGSDTLVEQLAEAREDGDIEAVVLRVDSPGGSALASDLIWREIARVREVKPVIVSMGGYAASGGYYIACGADSIFADSGTLTGSIGVFAGKLDWSDLYAKLGVRREFVTRGENALFWHDAGGFTDDQRRLFQAQLDRFYERFVAKVAAGRDLSLEAAEAAAQGRVWTGGQALQHGLVDGIGGLDRALVSARHMLGVAPDATIRVRVHARPMTWLERSLLGALRSHSGVARLLTGAGPAPWSDLPGPLSRLVAGLARGGLLDVLPLLDGQVLALLPWRDVPAQGSVGCP